jgi:hypothetical protein
MAWKDIFRFGGSNLTGNAERLEALGEARDTLKAMGYDKRTVSELIRHEQDHLFAFPDFEESSGKKLALVMEANPDNEIRLAVIPNRRHSRKDVRRALKAVDNPSDGDEQYGCISRFRK